MSSDEKYQKAKKRVEEIKGFYTHLITYILVNLGLFVINLVTSPQNWWFYYVSIFWGIGLLIHGIGTFGKNVFLGKDWEEKKIRQYMDEDKN